MPKSLLIASLAVLLVAESGRAQVEYRNLDGGRPVRVEDAAPTERHALDLDLTTLRVDWLSHLRERLLIEPRMAYGILPNTEFSIRMPIFFRERGQSPRVGISGIGVGGMHELRVESRRLPALALAGEAFLPVGPNASRPAYSAKALVTRSFPAGRLHLNAAYGTFSVRRRPSLVVTPSCGQLGQPACPYVPLPPIDGPCELSVSGDFPPLRSTCSAGSREFTDVASKAAAPAQVKQVHWLIGIAADKTLPLRSIVLVADVFVERFEGLGRPPDWTAEFGVRRQVSTRLVFDAAVGRHYSGTEPSTFLTFGTSFSQPFLVPHPR